MLEHLRAHDLSVSSDRDDQGFVASATLNGYETRSTAGRVWFAAGDCVEARDGADEEWAAGVVTEVKGAQSDDGNAGDHGGGGIAAKGVYVKLEGFENAYEYEHVRHAVGEVSEDDRSGSGHGNEDNSSLSSHEDFSSSSQSPPRSKIRLRTELRHAPLAAAAAATVAAARSTRSALQPSALPPTPPPSLRRSYQSDTLAAAAAAAAASEETEENPMIVGKESGGLQPDGADVSSRSSWRRGLLSPISRTGIGGALLAVVLYACLSLIAESTSLCVESTRGSGKYELQSNEINRPIDTSEAPSWQALTHSTKDSSTRGLFIGAFCDTFGGETKKWKAWYASSPSLWNSSVHATARSSFFQRTMDGTQQGFDAAILAVGDVAERTVIAWKHALSASTEESPYQVDEVAIQSDKANVARGTGSSSSDKERDERFKMDDNDNKKEKEEDKSPGSPAIPNRYTNEQSEGREASMTEGVIDVVIEPETGPSTSLNISTEDSIDANKNAKQQHIKLARSKEVTRSTADAEENQGKIFPRANQTALAKAIENYRKNQATKAAGGSRPTAS